jgi:hypothetical protein
MIELAAALLLQAETIKREDFERHIRFLSDDALKGRDNGTDEGRRAAQYVADRFKELGLKPGGRDGFFHDFAARLVPQGKEFPGRNVIGLLEGEDPKELIVVAAHHDARGVVGGKIQNGADDNASGVAMVLELAESFAKSRPRRPILFVSFDCEEDGLLGSREFVASGLYDPAAFAAVFVFDLIGGDFFEWEKSRIYALGSESSAELFDRVGRHAAAAKELEVARAGVFLIEPVPGLARSDYHAFRQKEVPFVFLSTGTPWYYHTEHDDIGVINFGKIEKAGRFCHGLIAETASDPKRPAFRKAAPREEDARLMKDALERLRKEKDRLRIDERQLESAAKLLEAIGSAKEPDPALLQRAMALLFSVARAQGAR